MTHHQQTPADTTHVNVCGCGPDCTCGCQEGKPCTCHASSSQGCGCGGHDGHACGCASSDEQASSGDVKGAYVARYTVSGMTCEHCVKAVTEEVSAIDGVTDAKVDLAGGSLQLASDRPIDFDRVVEAVDEAGDYTVA